MTSVKPRNSAKFSKTFQALFGTGCFIQKVFKKRFGQDLKSFSFTPWVQSKRTLNYEFNQTVAFSNYLVKSEAVETMTKSHQGTFYIVENVSQQSGIMYADYFTTKLHFRLSSVKSKSRSTRVQMTGYVGFHKSCMFQRRVETEAYTGIRKTYEVFEQMVRSMTKHDPVDNIENENIYEEIKENLEVQASSKKEDKDQEESLVSTRSQTVLLLSFVFILLSGIVMAVGLTKLVKSMELLNLRISELESQIKEFKLNCKSDAQGSLNAQQL